MSTKVGAAASESEAKNKQNEVSLEINGNEREQAPESAKVVEDPLVAEGSTASVEAARSTTTDKAQVEVPEHEKTPPLEAYTEAEGTSVEQSKPSVSLLKEPTTPPEAPETTVSLDKEEDVSDLEKSPPTDTENKSASNKDDLDNISARADPDQVGDEDSSNDDSSYFADPSNLPKPGSGRRFSWSDTASANNSVTRQHIQSAMSRESDASLSLSEDSDEDHHHHHARGHQSDANIGYFHQYAPSYPTPPQVFPQQPMVPTAGVAPGSGGVVYQQEQPPQFFITSMPPGGVPELYPEQIMRMHSVSSLVSESSQNNSSASDKSVQDELQNVAVEKARPGSSTVPSGRRSPILGQHPPSRGGGGGGANPIFASPPTVNAGPSPPTILQAPFGGVQQFPHPQPTHSMTQEQLAAWAAANARSTPLVQQQRQGGSFRSTESAYSRDSELAYSGDSDTQQRRQQQSRAMHPEHSGGSGGQRKSSRRSSRGSTGEARGGGGGPASGGNDRALPYEEKSFKVYWQRWIMLFYMSTLNLLSDWTCYSVAPIALLTEEAFGHINPEQLVVVFLCANGVSTACEPILLSRLGLRRTVLFGALLLMMGSIVKSGGMPPIIAAELQKGQGEWRVYLGFFLVGLSQPLYQCTPALLSASWFPERERTMATGVALNANQLGIGFAFIFGTLLVDNSDDIPKYFGLLSIISTLTFLGTLIQFDDAPPTPPSETARVMRGTLEVNLPASVQSIFNSVRNNIGGGPSGSFRDDVNPKRIDKAVVTKGDTKGRSSKDSNVRPSTVTKSRSAASLSDDTSESKRSAGGQRRRSRRSQRGSSGTGSASRRTGSSNTRRRNVKTSKSSAVATDSGLGAGYKGLAPPPSPARWSPVSGQQSDKMGGSKELESYPAPSPMLPGRHGLSEEGDEHDGRSDGVGQPSQQQQQQQQPQPYAVAGFPTMPVDERGIPYNPYQGYPAQYQMPYWDPRLQQQAFMQQQQAQQIYQQGYSMPPPDPYYNYYSYQHSLPPPRQIQAYNPVQNFLPAAGAIDEGAEPVLTLTAHHLDINIRDDQVLLSTKACLSRPGFIHSLVSFTVSGIVINTLSTFMDYLVRLNGAPRMYTGIVGGSFQFVIMISSLLVGRLCDKTRAYYSITIGMLVLGAFGLAECGVNLDANRGGSLRLSLIVVAMLVGPLQPVSTELGVDVVYPLSENTVLVIQQLFSNLLSAAFIPCFKAMKDYGAGTVEANAEERPEYTFSFYLLIVLHAIATLFFSTFNGKYLRYEHEMEKKAREDQRKNAALSARAFHRIGQDQINEQYRVIGEAEAGDEDAALLPTVL